MHYNGFQFPLPVPFPSLSLHISSILFFYILPGALDLDTFLVPTKPKPLACPPSPQSLAPPPSSFPHFLPSPNLYDHALYHPRSLIAASLLVESRADINVVDTPVSLVTLIK